MKEEETYLQLVKNDFYEAFNWFITLETQHNTALSSPTHVNTEVKIQET